MIKEILAAIAGLSLLILLLGDNGDDRPVSP